MNRSSKLAVLVALAVGSAPAWALTLGQIQVKSALDRPLVAVIPLHEDYPGEADHLAVTLAPADAFTRAGISRAALKVPLAFTVTTNASGQKVIRVTSTQPVREPYLDFLIQVTWPKGKLLREYVVLLDPLSMSAAPAVVPASAPAAPAPAAPAPAAPPPVAAPPPPPPAPAPAAPPRPAAGATTTSRANVYGPVKPGDNLSRIAQSHAMAGVSYQQMLLAIKSANPDAFFRDNINALKAGAILRIPSRAQATAVAPEAAIAEVRQQNREWQGIQASAPTLVASAGGTATPVNGVAKGTSAGDRLKLVPPESGKHGAGGTGSAAQATVTQLRQDLARSKEALASQKQASADLGSRVKSLQKIADQNKRLLALKNAQIAALQEKLAQARKAAGLPPATPASVDAAAVAAAGSAAGATATAAPATTASTGGALAAAATASTASVAGAAAATTSRQSAAAPAPAKAKAAHTPAATRPAPNQATPAAAPWYQQLWPRVALAVIIILLLILWLTRRRRRASGKEVKPSLADSFGDTPFGRDADAAAASAAAEDEADTGPVYTVDDDGEDELLAQLAEHPDNADLHLELVSLYYARGDVARFESAAEAMRPHVLDDADPEWQEVMAMGRELSPGHPLFANAASSGAQDDIVAGAADATALDDDRDVETPEAEAAVEEYTVEEPPEPAAHEVPEFGDAPTAMPDESEFDALPPLPAEEDAASTASDDDPHPVASAEEDDFASTFGAEDLEPAAIHAEAGVGPPFDADEDDAEATGKGTDFAPAFGDDDVITEGGFTDDPVDTKLDLARAYMDMGDHDGAHAMLSEALNEGTPAQKEVAQQLLDELG